MTRPTGIPQLLPPASKDTTISVGVYSDGGLYFGVGKDLDAANCFFGLIDDVRIYNVALSAKEIEELTL